MPAPDLADVRDAEKRIRNHIRHTPLIHSAGLSEQCGREVYLKLENQQLTGSFKVRGALNAIASLSPADRKRGVVTASAGNHGAGVALAARVFGVPATVFLPDDAPAAKRDRIREAGAEIRMIRGGYDQAHAKAVAHAAEGGAIYLHAFSDPAVVAGQGTVALEILSVLPELGTMVIPVGGGGLVGGMGIVARSISRHTRVVGVQTPETSAMYQSLQRGELVAAPVESTICEGLAGDIDQASFRLGREVIDEMVVVEEATVRRSIAWLFREQGVTAEGSGAVGVAALLGGLAIDLPAPVAVVITGGNIDPDQLRVALEEDH
ncbi:threonine ammonia-lyase [soil metagenome]